MLVLLGFTSGLRNNTKREGRWKIPKKEKETGGYVVIAPRSYGNFNKPEIVRVNPISTFSVYHKDNSYRFDIMEIELLEPFRGQKVGERLHISDILFFYYRSHAERAAKKIIKDYAKEIRIKLRQAEAELTNIARQAAEAQTKLSSSIAGYEEILAKLDTMLNDNRESTPT